MASIVTLTTDFGLSDGYVGVMKGVLLAVSPRVQIIDITHDIEPGNVQQAAFVLGASYKFFPRDTVHIVVVDPGVGTDRNALCIKALGQYFVGPDNGVFSYIIADATNESESQPDEKGEGPKPRVIFDGIDAVRLTNEKFWLREVSSTFHGRDVFAPVAARLPEALLAEMGEPVDAILAYPRPMARIDEQGRMLGQVLHVDRFGNLISNVRTEQIQGRPVTGTVEGHAFSGPVRTYGDGADLFALIGSAGYVEIAVKNGSAASRTGARVGSRVVLERTLL